MNYLLLNCSYSGNYSDLNQQMHHGSVEGHRQVAVRYLAADTAQVLTEDWAMPWPSHANHTLQASITGSSPDAQPDDPDVPFQPDDPLTACHADREFLSMVHSGREALEDLGPKYFFMQKLSGLMVVGLFILTCLGGIFGMQLDQQVRPRPVVGQPVGMQMQAVVVQPGSVLPQ